MPNTIVYQELSHLDGFKTWLPYFAVTAFIVYAWFFKLGEIFRHHLAARVRPFTQLSGHTDWILGVWVAYSFHLALGVVGGFSQYAVLIGGILIVAYAVLGLKLRWLPELQFAQLWRQERFLFLMCALVAFLYGFASSATLLPWFDGLFAASGGHMARTGKLLPLMGEGQHAMSVLTGMTAAFFPGPSVLNPISAWSPWHAPFLLCGMVSLLRAVFGHRRWDALAVLIFAFPLAFKAIEFRGSVIGMGFFLWSAAAWIRYLRSRSPADLLISVMALASAWNFSPATTIVVFLFYVLWAGFEWLASETGKRGVSPWVGVWRLLFLTAVIQAPHIVHGFAWSKLDRPLWVSVLPLVLALAFAYAMMSFAERESISPAAPASTRKSWILPLVATIAIVWAYVINPSHAPTFNWVFFAVKASFPMLNFTSYGLPGYVFALVIGLAILRCRRDEIARLITVGFLVSCIFQILPIYLLKYDLNPIGERTYIWDIWKNGPLYWSNPFMVLGFAWGLNELAARFKRMDVAWTRPRVAAGVFALVWIPLQSTAPYAAVFSEPDAARPKPWIERVMQAHLATHTDSQWRGQQTYSIPMYLAYARGVVKDFWLGRPARIRGCSDCTAHSYAFMKHLAPMIDTLILHGAGVGETFVTGDSVTNFEIYMRRRLRYRNGPDTICPLYVQYWSDLTVYEKYWRDRVHIRRNSQGVFYTVDDPETNLVWVRSPDYRFRVPFTGDWELFRGTDLGPAPARISLDGVERGLSSTDTMPSLQLGRLEAGREYTLQVETVDASKGAYVPIVVYPKRDWNLERHLIDRGGNEAIGFLALMKFTSIPSAEVTAEDMQELFGNPDPAVRARTVERWKIRYLILDGAIRAAYPQADLFLSADPAFERLEVRGVPVYRRI